MNIDNKLNPFIAYYLVDCMRNIEIIPSQTINTLYFMENGQKNLVELMLFIEHVPNFQEMPKLRELYRVGRNKLEQACRLLPSQYSATNITNSAKRALSNDEDELSPRKLTSLNREEEEVLSSQFAQSCQLTVLQDNTGTKREYAESGDELSGSEESDAPRPRRVKVESVEFSYRSDELSDPEGSPICKAAAPGSIFL
jgi:hypothetical protein